MDDRMILQILSPTRKAQRFLYLTAGKAWTKEWWCF